MDSKVKKDKASRDDGRSVGASELESKGGESVKTLLGGDDRVRAGERLESSVKTKAAQDEVLSDIDPGASVNKEWYIINTYSGYEDQVADQLRQRVESLGLSDQIFQVIVPVEKQIEIKNGKRRVVDRKIFPGYVMVEMIMSERSWYIVRNTPNVTGFIGFGIKPTPLAQKEVDRIYKRMGVKEPTYNIEVSIGDLVRITDGALKGFEAKVEEVDERKGRLKVRVSMFGRETPVNLDFLQVQKI